MNFEPEVAVVMGRIAKNVSVENAMDYVLGFTCVNDVTLRDLQGIDPTWTRAKGFDTSCPLGPWIDVYKRQICFLVTCSRPRKIACWCVARNSWK